MRPLFKNPFLKLALIILTLYGCGTSGPSKFYTLSPIADREMEPLARAMDRGMAIGISRIKLPEYLDRPQIVTRSGRNAIEIDEFNHWAGSLRDDLSRVLADNLSKLLQTDRIQIYPWRKSLAVKYLVMVEITRFDGSLGGDVFLDTRWTIIDDEQKRVLVMKKSSIKEASEAGDHGALVAAQSRALGHLSREIAVAVLDSSD